MNIDDYYGPVSHYQSTNWFLKYLIGVTQLGQSIVRQRKVFVLKAT